MTGAVVVSPPPPYGLRKRKRKDTVAAVSGLRKIKKEESYVVGSSVVSAKKCEPDFRVVKCRKKFNPDENIDEYEEPPPREDFKMLRWGRSVEPASNHGFFPSPVHRFAADLKGLRRGVDYEIEEPTYPEGIEDKDPLKVVIGKKLEVDVFSLLSNGGKRDFLVRYDGTKVSIDSLRGKYLLICCFFVPVIDDYYDAEHCRAMIAAYSQLVAAGESFEMVMVAKMRSDLLPDEKDEKAAFKHFFSAFPCPAVPFSDIETRDVICQSLDLGVSAGFRQYAALVLDPNQMVLQTDAHIFKHYGASAFPFTDPHLEDVHKQDVEIKCRLDVVHRHWCNPRAKDEVLEKPLSLEELLGCNASDVLYKSGRNHLDKISIKELGQKKCIGVYLCYDGRFMDNLLGIYQDCAAKHLEFEVVLVYLPFSGDETYFIQAVDVALKKRNITSWWVLPFVDEVSRRLFRIGDLAPEDKLMILADGGKSGEIKGIGAISRDYSYPFTRRHILDDELSRLRSFTLESLLRDAPVDCIAGEDSPKAISVSELKGKKVLLYLNSHDDEGHALYKLLVESYGNILKDYPGTQLVTIRMDKTSPMIENPPGPAIPATQVLVSKRLYGSEWFTGTVIAIGEEGRILCRYAERCLQSYGKFPSCSDTWQVPLFTDTLPQEIAQDLYYEVVRY